MHGNTLAVDVPSAGEASHATAVGDWSYDHLRDEFRPGRPACPDAGAASPQAASLSAWLQCIHPADRGAVRAHLVDAKGSPDAPTLCYRHLWPDGHWSWIELWAQVERRDECGRPLLSAGGRQDITRLHTAETLLALQFAFTEVLAGAPDRATLCQAILDMALGLPEFDGGGLYWRHASGAYSLIVDRGLGPALLEAVGELAADSPKARLIEHGRMLCSAVEGSSQRLDFLIAEPAVAGDGIRALVVLPIVAAGRSVACLNLCSRSLRTLPRATVRALQAMALQFGQALDRLCADEQAAQRQHNLEGFMAALQDFVFVLDAERRLLYFSPSVRLGLGYGDELLGRSVLDLHPEAVRAEAAAVVADMLAGRRASCPLPLLRADGSEVVVDTRVVRSHWNGQPALLGISRDITEQRQAEVRLQEAAMFLRESQAIAKVGGWKANPETGRLLWTEEVFRLCEHPTDEPPASLDEGLQYYAPESLPAVRAALAHTLATGEPFTLSCRMVARSGREFWAELRCVGRVRDDREGSYLTGTFQDVTERREAELRLAASEERHRAQLERLVSERTAALQAANRQLTLSDLRLTAMFNMSQSAGRLSEDEVLQLGIDEAVRLTGSEIGYLHFVNDDQESLRLATWSTGTLRVCSAAHENHYPVSRAGVWADSVRTLRPVVHNDYPNLPARRGYPSGHVALRRHLCVPVIERGKVRMLLGVGNKDADYDSSDTQELQFIGNDLWSIYTRRRTELQLAEAKAAADAASVAKTAFLANMSHEMRTPLNAINGMTHLVRRSGVAPAQAERLDRIDAASRHLLEIINAVLDLSKIEAGKVELIEQPVDLPDLFQHVTSMLAVKAQEKGLQFVAEPAGLPFVVLGDRTRLQQALLNYATNAVKFTDRGRVVLRVRQQALREGRATLRFEVEDNGIGVPPDRLPKLFHAFEQADNTISRRYGGTGLGLAITRKLAELMGGSAGADSEPGRGSTFWFTVNLKTGGSLMPKAPSVDAERVLASLRQAHGGKRLLLVEDDPVNREVALALLEDTGLSAEAAVDGAQAVAMVTRQCYDLILMDMQMPVMDGLEATRCIRRLPGCAATPIVAMTANAYDEDRQRCLDAGMDDFIAKPIDPPRLFLTVLDWLRRA